MRTHQSTALLIFARSPESEARIKGFHPKSYKRSCKIARRLLQHTRQQARATGLPVFIIDEKQQSGASFGLRLANAMELVWQSGYEKLIVIGSDNPNLTTAQLRQVDQRLHASPWVLGPARDGGTWLIGLHRQLYDRTAWIQLPWLTDQVFPALRNWLEERYKTGVILATAMDLDHAGDLRQFLAVPNLGDKLRTLLTDLLRPRADNSSGKQPASQGTKTGFLPQRAPPSPI